VQSKLDRLAEWRLIDLQTQAGSLVDQQRGLHRFLSDGSEVAGTFSATIMRKLQAIAEELAMLESEQELQRGCHLDERRRLRRAEIICGNLEYEARCKDTLRQLSETVETAMQRRP
jgi:hypothetical protein